jgi:gamma-glutamyltranspeptidase/glutathione hydrolase
VVVHAVDHALPVGDAVALSRVHPHGDSVECEGGVPGDVLDALVASGENVSRWPGLNGYFGGCQAVARDADGTLTAAADPRRGGAGLVVP